MNFRNRKLVIVIRTILGLMFIGSGVSGLLGGREMTGVPAPMIESMRQLWDVGIFHLIKITELVAGLMLVTGFLPALALLFLAPVCVGIIVYNAKVVPAYLVGGLVVSALTSYLGYAYWDKYKEIFRRG